MRQPLRWATRKPLIGMVHLRPLPGSPRWDGSLQQVIDAAVADAKTLEQGGIDGIFIENFGDTPFFPESVPPVVVATLTAVTAEVRRHITIPIGINVLRNDAAAALAVCAATGASFIRVNVHTGALLTDQGWISGRAHETLRLRAALGSEVAIYADVFVKHAAPPANLTIDDAARDTWQRGHADALIVSGSGTGKPTEASVVRRVKAALPDAPVFVGSGLTTENAASLLQEADGAIVGTSLKSDGRVECPVSAQLVQRLVDVVAGIR